MLTCILPTAPILREFSRHDNLFDFYKDGVKGAVRDFVFVSKAWELRRSISLFNSLLGCHFGLGEDSSYRLHQNDVCDLYFESILRCIDKAVGNMMADLFTSSIYTVDRTKWDWYGDDLIIRINILDSKKELSNV